MRINFGDKENRNKLTIPKWHDTVYNVEEEATDHETVNGCTDEKNSPAED